MWLLIRDRVLRGFRQKDVWFGFSSMLSRGSVGLLEEIRWAVERVERAAWIAVAEKRRDGRGCDRLFGMGGSIFLAAFVGATKLAFLRCICHSRGHISKGPSFISPARPATSQ